MAKLWGGRFQKKTSQLMEDFHSSLPFDQKLYKYDLLGSRAHALMLGQQKIISPADAEKLVKGLEELLTELEAGRIELPKEAEDIHSCLEELLTAKVGPVGKMLHTARSRNDQVALDLRMYLKEEIKEVKRLLNELIRTLLGIAEKHLNTVMPGYTHLQRAQPVTLAHHLLAYVQMFERDRSRLEDCYRRTDVMPLGAGALAGTTFPVEPKIVAAELGFSALAINSLDAVSDRDFVVEFAAAAALIMVHLSRFCEEIVLWSTAEFAFIELDDAFATGSSMMPQKKNPDAAELIRGKTGRVFGSLISLLTMLKGLPLAYNKDLQEDKEALFNVVDTLKKSLLVFCPMLATMEIKKENLALAARGGFTNATDLADYLVQKGVPFREAHQLVSKIVYDCLKLNKTLEDLSLEEYKKHSPLINEDVYAAINIQHCVAVRQVLGGPAPASVLEVIQRTKEKLNP